MKYRLRRKLISSPFFFFYKNDDIYVGFVLGGLSLRFNIYTYIFMFIAVVSNLVFIYVFEQGILAVVLAIIFLILAGYSTTFNLENKDSEG